MSKDNLTPDGAHIAPDSAAPVEMTEADIAPVPDVEPEAIPLRWVRVSHHTPDHIASRYLYAAYGSNLSLEQMVRRCPTADIVGQGTLRGAKLVFAYYMGIVEAENASTPMGVYKMTAADVAAMDRAEGLGHGGGYRHGGSGYERYLVTVEMKGVAVRCFTYVKRDNALEEPSERYYQTCLRGYADWNFDTRRLRHAKEDARKNGKRRTYSSQYGYWDSTQSAFDWDSWRKGTGAINEAINAMPRPTPSKAGRNTPGSVWDEKNKCWRWAHRRPLQTPVVPSYDEMLGYDQYEPEGGNGTGAGMGPPKSGIPPIEPRRSLVTGRELPSSKQARKNIRQAVDNFKAKHGTGQTTFVNGKGERWELGNNGVWYRAKE